MAGSLENLRELRNQMAERGWAVTCFRFRYRHRDYIVLVERYVYPRMAPQYQLVELTFVDSQDPEKVLVAPANTQGIAVGAKELREFFGIEWVLNLGDLLRQFVEYLGRFIPMNLPADLDSGEREAILRRLGAVDSDDPSRKYCFGVRRNPVQKDGTPGQRSLFNSQKTEMLRPDLFEKLKNDTNISFMYATEPSLERTDVQILRRFADESI